MLRERWRCRRAWVGTGAVLGLVWMTLLPGVRPEQPVRAAAEARFQTQEIASEFGVGYAVRVGDVNGDGRPDVVAINGTQLVWFENPGWTRHLVLDRQTPPDNVSIALHDADGDGRLDVALGAAWNPRNTASGGTLHWVTRTSGAPEGQWTVVPVAEEPTLHRIGWADVDGDRQQELVVTPLHGRGTAPPEWQGPGARVLVFEVPARPQSEPWRYEVADTALHILHNFTALDADGDGREELVTASREGLHVLAKGAGGAWTRRRIGDGAPGEVRPGRVAGRRRLATIEPWHGTSLVLYSEAEPLWERRVLDGTLTGGHALAWADLDGDGDEELVVGWREPPVGLAMYKLRPDGTVLRRTMLDAGGMATEDVAVADLDADGRIDVVAAGRATRNLRIYWNRGS